MNKPGAGVASTVALVVVALVGGLWFSDRQIAAVTRPRPGKLLNLSWGNYLSASDRAAGWVTEFYGTTNCHDFYYVTNTALGAVNVAMFEAGVFEGFICRHVHTNSGFVTGWNVK